MLKRIRYALCELVGGHISEPLFAGSKDRKTHVQLHCVSCGKLTRWFGIPPTSDIRDKSPDQEWG